MDYIEQIKDNFWYVQYNDLKIVVDRNTGYVNASKLCEKNNKEYSLWDKNKKTMELFEKLENPSYEIKSDNINELTEKYTGNYIHIYLLKYLISWIQSNKNELKNLVYVISNKYLEPQNIYKIGMTNKTIEEKLQWINKHRYSSDLCFVKLLYSCDNSNKLKYTIHEKLKNYRENGEYFKCQLSVIEEAFSEEECEQVL